MTDNNEFSPGRIVALKADPAVQGAVIEVLPSQPENQVRVFVEGNVQTYYASQLKVEDRSYDEVKHLSGEQFHAHLTALQIQQPSISTLYSLNAARVDFIPYQFRPVLRFIRSDRPRLLIADGVGVGKTIEAGLILRELQARRDVKSVLIICPRPLVTERKWQSEMKRFDERFTHLDGTTLRYCINEMDLEGVWPEQYHKVILPYSLFDELLLYGPENTTRRKRVRGLLDLDPPPRFDLVVVDEAHHIRDTSTYSHQAVRFFCDHAEAAIFLTATPVQLGSHDLFVLLNTLRPDLIRDEDTFQHMAEPNPYINQAVNHTRAQEPDWTFKARDALEQAASTPWGQAILSCNPEFNRIRKQIAEGSITPDERVQLISDIEALHTFSGIINRTRRRDIGAFTIRKPETVVVEFTTEQKLIHDELLRVQAEIYARLHGDINVRFMLTTIRRQAASCLYGLVPFLENILNRHIDDLEWAEMGYETADPYSDSANQIQSQINNILEKARFLDPYDPKYERLRSIIRDKQILPNNKIMLFSSFRHTLHYLHGRLKADGARVEMVHGGTPDEERVLLRSRFEKPHGDNDSLDVLLFSEIGCEGLDYQFCDCIVNYDLPWNPMRVEQRIGRIDRKGQKSESVAIVNLITPGTVDADIYERCLMRVGVFNSALGGSEEILGQITKEIRNIAENYTLSEDDRREQLQQLADNKIRQVQEEEKLEQGQMELFGIRLPEDQMKQDVEDASSFWLTPESILRLVTLYIQRKNRKEQEFILGEKPLKTLRLSQEVRNSLLTDFRQIPRQQNSTFYREWENWLKGGDPHLSITFDPKCAMQHPEAAFIMPLHPLVKQAAISSGKRQQVVTFIKAQSDKVPTGQYEFAVYQWRFHGIREDLELKLIGSSDTVAPHLAHLLEKAVDADDPGNLSELSSDKLDKKHYQLWSEARAKHQQQNQELAEFRKESLSTSHKARIGLLHEQLNHAENENIRRMRQSQLDSAEADYKRRVQELDDVRQKADITAEPVAYGVLNVGG